MRQNIRGNEQVEGHPIRVYDDGGSGDHYTVVFVDQPEHDGLYAALGMSALPFHPQGVGQHCAAKVGPHLGRRIPFASLPEDCQRAVKQEWA